MTRSRTAGGQRPPIRPFEEAQLSEEKQIADEVTRIMDSIRDFDQDKVKATVWWKSGNGTGTWKWCDDVSLPPDIPAVMGDMRERFGAGDYEIRVSAQGRVRANSLFSIAKEKMQPLAAAPPAPAPGFGMAEMFGMMMTMQAEARRDSQAAADRQAAAMAEDRRNTSAMLTAVLPAALPLLLRQQQPQTTVSDTVALVAALQQGKGGGGIKDTLEAMAAFKALLGDQGGGERGGEGFDPEDLIGSSARLVGPAMKALGDYLHRQREGPAAAAAPPGGGDQLALAPPTPAPSRYRIIDLVRVDVVYLFERGHEPAKAADLIYDVIEANNVTEAEIDELATTFAFSPTGLEDLAREGIDLRARPQWAADFFAALAAIHQEQGDDLGGDEGREADFGGHGAPGAQG